MLDRRRAMAAIGATGLALFSVDLRAAKSYEIKMLNRDPNDPARQMVFSPELLKVPAGSTITFTPTDPGHNVQSTPGMIPPAAKPWRFGFGKSGSITLSTSGVYGYHCMPHRGMGMVGLIIVEGPGMRDNLAAAKEVKQVGKAAEKWSELWVKAEKLL